MRLLSNSIIATYLVVLVGTFLLARDMLPYRINITDSLPWGIYQKTAHVIERGAITAECLPLELATFAKERGYLEEGRCPGEVMPILKEIVGVAGDEIELTDAYVAVNGRVILNSETRKQDSKGRAMPTYPRGIFVVKPGEVFLLATNSERSWDSRYTGPAQIKNIIETMRPVWTEAEND